MSNVTFNGHVTDGTKRLWHVQSITDWHEEPYDLFVWSENAPNKNEIEGLYRSEEEGMDSEQVQDFVNNANVYSVYAEEL